MIAYRNVTGITDASGPAPVLGEVPKKAKENEHHINIGHREEVELEAQRHNLPSLRVVERSYLCRGKVVSLKNHNI